MAAGDTVERAAERAARVSYGRLLAYLSRAFRDVAAAEDALADAFAKALETWPVKGVPASPEGWLMVTARNRLLDATKARKIRVEATRTIMAMTESTLAENPDIPDKRLELMFVCAHAALDPAVHAPLMLQTVLGIDAARIASCFLVAPATMGQRLSRAKARIRVAGIRFEAPELGDLPARASSVREAIFAAYATGWGALGSGDAARAGLSGEAIWLARVLNDLVPVDAEAKGLLAMMLLCEARRNGRFVDGCYIPLREQATGSWNRSMLLEGEATLAAAAALQRPGRFQIEAAIQSANTQSVLNGTSMARPLLDLHRSLVGFAPTVGNFVALAAAIADVEGPLAGLAALERMDPARIATFQPWWAVRAHLLVRSGSDRYSVIEAYERAIGLSEDEATRAYLRKMLVEAGG